YFSEGSKKILGVSDPLFGNDPNAWNIRVHPDDKEKYFQDFKDHLTGLKPMYENEHRVKCEDDSYKWIRDRGKIIEWASPSVPRRVVGTHTDITAQKQQEQAVNDALIIASEHNNKLKNFAHIVTHNLKQHTANFESLLEFYDDAKDLGEKEEIITHLKTLSHGLTKTIVNLNDVVHVQNSRSKEVKKIFIAEDIDNTLAFL